MQFCPTFPKSGPATFGYSRNRNPLHFAQETGVWAERLGQVSEGEEGAKVTSVANPARSITRARSHEDVKIVYQQKKKIVTPREAAVRDCVRLQRQVFRHHEWDLPIPFLSSDFISHILWAFHKPLCSSAGLNRLLLLARNVLWTKGLHGSGTGLVKRSQN
jgi:hypothetical protein